MKPISLYILSAAFALSSTAAVAQKQTPPAGGEPRNFTLPAKQEFTLPNGLQATLVPYGALPKVTVSLIVQVGNVHEQESENGLADITGQLMREGTASLNAKQIADQAARMGGSVNVSVGSNQTSISGSVLSEYGPELVKLLADLVQHPAFPESEMARIKNDFKRNMNLARSQPSTQADVKFRMALYKGHAYGRDLPTDAQINAFTTEQVRDFYQRQFGAQRTGVYVAGKFEANAMRQAITSALSEWQQGPPPRIEIAQPVTKPDLLLLDRPGAPQSTLIIGLPTIDPSHPDYTKLRVMNSLLGGSFGSRITSNIRENKGYTYSPRSTVAPRYRVADWSEVADVTTEHTGNSLKEIVNEVERLQKEAPSPEELKGIQNYEAGLFVLRNSTPEGIINQLSFLDLHGLPDTYLTNQVQAIHAVTPQEVKDLTKKYIRPEDMTMVVVGDKKVITPQIKKFQAETKKKAL
ncbi:M16 family metallopeptidase [Adhaeribacter pallidiroseus]|uniref:Putative mitochondrial-processing peptidase subunit beta n=1 Tax=Adhaeribacter pallidiroseus TaxID=2072847 RepID=A0A369QKK1_9BACT|nr:pitrilysin family protein [Adhaeribacter pallidiroseus]RDC65431.1 putative mitochondrial-processing peptidase subunit beta [Adhaeribacter pallidiroseus]